MMKKLLLSLFFWWENRDPERLRNNSKHTQLGNGSTVLQIQAVWLQNPNKYHPEQFCEAQGVMFKNQNLELLHLKKMLDHKPYGIYASNARMSAVLPTQHFCHLIWRVQSQVSLGNYPLPHCLHSPWTVNQNAPPLPWPIQPTPTPTSRILISERFCSLIPGVCLIPVFSQAC